MGAATAAGAAPAHANAAGPSAGRAASPPDVDTAPVAVASTGVVASAAGPAAAEEVTEGDGATVGAGQGSVASAPPLLAPSYSSRAPAGHAGPPRVSDATLPDPVAPTTSAASAGGGGDEAPEGHLGNDGAACTVGLAWGALLEDAGGGAGEAAVPSAANAPTHAIPGCATGFRDTPRSAAGGHAGDSVALRRDCAK